MGDNRGGNQLKLAKKVAVIFGAGGEVGAAVAREFAAQGASVFLSGRTASRVQTVADEITRDGGAAAVAQVDALDEGEVNLYLNRVIAEKGKIDILFNAMGPQAREYENASRTMELPVEKFLVPIKEIVASQFITARAGAKHMVSQQSGLILILSATPAKGTAPNLCSIGATYGAVESLVRCLAVELSPRGVRVVCVRSMGMTQTRVMQQSFEIGAKAMGATKEKVEEMVISRALLRRSPSVDQTARLMSFLASDDASTLTGAIVNSSCGQVLD